LSVEVTIEQDGVIDSVRYPFIREVDLDGVPATIGIARVQGEVST